MGIRQQKREKPNTYAKTNNTDTVRWSGKSQKVSKKAASKAPSQPNSDAHFLLQDLTRTAIAFIIAVGILSIIWWWQYR